VPKVDNFETKLEKDLANKADKKLHIRQKEIENPYGKVIFTTPNDFLYFELNDNS